MRRSLLWKLLGINLLVVAVAVVVASLTIRQFADAIFAGLMSEFHIQTGELHRLFMLTLTRSLVLAGLAAGGIGLLLSLVLFRRVVDPVREMKGMAARIASGDYAARARVASADELGSLAESLNRMADALATLERLRKELVSNVAHELRTPLTNLRGYLEAIHEGVAPASSEMVASLHEEVMRLVRLVEALQTLTRFDARPRPQLEHVDMETLIRRQLDLYRGQFAARRIVLETQIAAVRPLHADSDLLAQAVQNLLDNALKYTPDGGRVELEIAPADGAVRITVTNNGEAIAAEDLPHIFERFYRGEKSRSRESGGAGIGLAIVREVAALHGGQVGAQSANGLTTVWLSLAITPQ